MAERVYAYIEHEGRVAVFDQAARVEAGLQVPGGGVETEGAVVVEHRFFHVRPLDDVAETWTWFERHASDGSGPLEFHLRWLPIAEAAAALDFGFGALLGELDSSVARAEAAARDATS